MSQESLRTQLDQETGAALSEYAEQYDCSEREAMQELLKTGLQSHESPQPADAQAPSHSDLEQQQRAIADQQGHIVRFQKYTVYGGLGWALLTLVTGANGSLWIAIGMLLIVLMASSTYIWQYIPMFQ
ncbi:MAG: hypothetical protein A07HN63_00915 [uncultured archaeon A07HN63]|nr:MAG: hypothetical protein A07HN63_00915 [uncultured archaeon A07HN63]